MLQDKNEPEARINKMVDLGKKALAENDIANALQLFRAVYDSIDRISNEFARANALLHYGNTLVLDKKIPEATQVYCKSFRISTACTESGLRYGELLLARGAYNESLVVLQKVLEVAPEHPEALYYAATCLIRLGEHLSASKLLNEALRISPDYPAARIAKFFLAHFSLNVEQETQASVRAVHFIILSPFMKDWLGGQNYILSAIKSLSMLPARASPRIILVILIRDWMKSPQIIDVVRSAVISKAVYAIFDENLNEIYLSRRAFRYRSRFTNSQGGANNWKHRLVRKSKSCFPMMYPMWALGNLGRPVYWIPDFQHHFLPENFSLRENLSRTIDISALASENVRVLLSSFDALSHFDHISRARMCMTNVWQFCSTLLPSEHDLRDEEMHDLGLPKRFYYVANQFWPHKNHKVVLYAMKLLADKGIAIDVVFSGSDLKGSSDCYHQELTNIINDLNLDRQITLVGVTSRPVQLGILRRAKAVIQPSSFEGWSTVIEDAICFGVPVIASSLAVNREQLKQNGIYFDKENSVELAEIIMAVDYRLPPGPHFERELVAEKTNMKRIISSAYVLRDILAGSSAASFVRPAES